MSPVYAAQMEVAENAAKQCEADFLYGDGNLFGIYQIKTDIPEARDFRFTPMSELETRGLPVERKNYELIYSAPLTDRIEFLTDRNSVLNKIYEKFNLDRPEEFKGHSLSVSDVVVLKYNGDYSSHFVDSVGFVEIDGFLRGENQKAQVSENSEKTYSQAEAAPRTEAAPRIGNTSKNKNAPVTKSKPTLMQKLEENKEKAARQGQSGTHKSKELEV